MPDIDVKTRIAADGSLLRRVAGTIDDITLANLAADTALTARLVPQLSPSGGDDTAAIQALITASAALPYIGCPIIRLASGVFTVSAAFTGNDRALAIIGAGKENTQILFTATGDVSMLKMGTFSAAGGFGGLQNLRLEHLEVRAPDSAYANAGSRTHTCIEDNGGGNIYLNDVNLVGWKRGVWAAHGSDFDTFINSDFEYCDVGIYLGPNSQQFFAQDVMFLGCEEGMVLERCRSGLVQAGYFIDSGVSDVTVAAATTTRSGVTTISNPPADMSVTFDECWWESNADGSDTRVPPRHILTQGNNSDGLPRYLRVCRPRIVAGGTGTDTFMEIGVGSRFYIEDGIYEGGALSSLVLITAGEPLVYMRDMRTVDGYSAPSRFVESGGGSDNGCYYFTAEGRRYGGIADTNLFAAGVNGDTVDRYMVTAAGRVEWGSGSATRDVNIYRSSAGILGLAGHLTIDDAKNIITNTTTGTKIGTNAAQKIGFYNATPVVQGASVADATDAASAITQLNALISRIEATGLIATV